LSREVRDRRLRGGPWTGEEDELVRALSPAHTAAKTGRTLNAVYRRRHALWLTR
jgi:hypothetical protein